MPFSIYIVFYILYRFSFSTNFMMYSSIQQISEELG